MKIRAVGQGESLVGLTREELLCTELALHDGQRHLVRDAAPIICVERGYLILKRFLLGEPRPAYNRTPGCLQR